MSELPKSVSIVIRSYNEAWAIDDTLEAVKSQNFEGDIEVIVIDSGSDDGSQKIIEHHQPAIFHQIPKGTYVPGVVLNWGISKATSEWVLFLNADATPADNQWLSEMLKAALADDNVGIVFGRQAPRSDCWPVYAHDYKRCFGPNRESHQWGHFFSMVSCAVKKTTWKQYPIREDLQYAEDDEWSRRISAAGLNIVFAEKSVAIHSHNYTMRQAYKRAYGDMLALSQAHSVSPSSLRFVGTVVKGTIADVLRDWGYFSQIQERLSIIQALPVRFAQRYGRWKANHAVPAS